MALYMACDRSRYNRSLFLSTKPSTRYSTFTRTGDKEEKIEYKLLLFVLSFLMHLTTRVQHLAGVVLDAEAAVRQAVVGEEL